MNFLSHSRLFAKQSGIVARVKELRRLSASPTAQTDMAKALVQGVVA